MSQIPQRITICREAGYHTEHIGHYGERQQYVGFAFYLEPNQQELISVLHLFDEEGKYLNSYSWETEAEAELAKAIGQLPNAHPCDVSVELFDIELFGRQFGLIPREDGCIAYMPYDLLFCPPWDGLYST